MAELYFAAKNQEWYKVEVSRPLEAVVYSERGPPRAVPLGFRLRTLEAFVASRIRPAMPNPPPDVAPRPAGNYSFACRGFSVPVTKSITKTRALPCRRAESRNFSPLASPAIVVSATFLSFARLADAQAAAGWAWLPLTFPRTRPVDPLGHRPVCFRVPVGRSTLWGHPLTQPRRTGIGTPRCTGRRTTAIAESSED